MSWTCSCSWPPNCGGNGVRRCIFHGDDCYCQCPGEEECFGCTWCNGRDGDDEGEDDR